MPMRILLLSFVLNNRWSGMGKWSHEVAANLARRGHEVELWFADDFPFLRRLGRLTVLAAPLALAATLIRRRRDFDVILLHEPLGFWYGCVRRWLRQLPPYVAICHNIESKVFRVMRAAADHGLAVVPRASKVKVPLFRTWQSDGSIRLADHVVCLSSEDLRYAVTNLGRNRRNASFVSNGVDSAKFARRADVRRSQEQRVLFVGGWLDIKGRLVLARMWPLIKASVPEARLTVVGSGCDRSRVLADFRDEFHATIDVIPRVDDEAAMNRIVAQHDLYLMPSLTEATPLALLEAMATGIPVVASRAGGIPDIIEHEVNGLLFDPLRPEDGAREVIRLLCDEGLRRRLGDEGMREAKSRSWSNTARGVEFAARRALARGGQRRRGSLRS